MPRGGYQFGFWLYRYVKPTIKTREGAAVRFAAPYW